MCAKEHTKWHTTGRSRTLWGHGEAHWQLERLRLAYESRLGRPDICSAIADGLVSELRVRIFSKRRKGTLVLDEIGKLPHGVKAKLLRLLESGQVQRVGSLLPLGDLRDA